MSGDLVGARSAEAALDGDVVLAIAELARTEARPERGGALLLDHDFAGRPASERIDAAFGSNTDHVVVGELDHVVVGYSIVRISEQGAVRLAMIDELVVHPDARGVGVAAAMLDQMRSWAVEHECAALESQVLPGNREAKNFFERVGMVTRQMRVSTLLN